MVFEHKSVLLEETIDSLRVKPDGIYVDGTLGGGGHAYELCKRLSGGGDTNGLSAGEAANGLSGGEGANGLSGGEGANGLSAGEAANGLSGGGDTNGLSAGVVANGLGGGRHVGGGRLVGLDQDADAIRAATGRLAGFADRVTVVRSNYGDIKQVLSRLGIASVDGIYLDLGVSSYQVDTVDRGFTYREDAPLDMRMDQRNQATAADIVNTYEELALYRMIRDYGEDRFAKNIAKHIAAARAVKPFETTGELAEVVKAAIPMKFRAVGGHPAKKTFQAIRIELNQELRVLEQSIDTMVELLNPGGRLAIITFHSLEDRIVKNKFRTNESPCECPPEFPVCVCGKVSKGKVITRKPVLPSTEEIAANKRAKSSKLRVFERT